MFVGWVVSLGKAPTAKVVVIVTVEAAMPVGDSTCDGSDVDGIPWKEVAK